MTTGNEWRWIRIEDAPGTLPANRGFFFTADPSNKSKGIFLYDGLTQMNYTKADGEAVWNEELPRGLTVEEAQKYAETIWRMSQ